MAPADKSLPAAAATTSDPAARPRILLVDDTRANLEVLMAALKADYKLGVATSGAKALEYVDHTPPDLILLDIMMPEMDGYQVCARLKGDGATRDIPVIFITALSEVDEKVKGFELGAVDYITKPFEPVEVRARVRTHLQLERLRRDLARQNQALTAAYGRLERQHRELEGRDRLVRFQMTNDSLERAREEVLAVACQVFQVSQATLFEPTGGGERLRAVAARGLEGEERFAVPDALDRVPGISCADPAALEARVLRGRAPLCQGSAAAAGLFFGDQALGVLSLRGISDREADAEALADALGRLAAEAALVLRTARITEDLDAGRLQADDLIALAEEGDLS